MTNNDHEPEPGALAGRFGPRLEAELEDLAASTESTVADRAPVELDQQSVGRLSRMDALQGQAMAQAADRRRRARRGQIEAALRRMADGEYGYCLECGAFIGLKRLEIDPAAALCVACAGSRGA
ncbi:TraR/DksA family transcriptional regulator [Faunimonas sp. B44]|uniref:TraR/DksA family transcriptional regulator n=1 Tax=Faunimonas sp. B44 TaxID=3461493 RepID=UPI0040449084